MIKSIFFLASLSLLTSCSALSPMDDETIKSQSAAVDASDGIDKNEAVVLTRAYMLNNRLDKQWSLRWIKVSDDGEDWGLSCESLAVNESWSMNPFSKKVYTLQDFMPLLVSVRKTDGQIQVTKTIVTESNGKINISPSQ
jgi:hypothetical protein